MSAKLQVYEVVERDPDGHPTASVERACIDWPFAEYPQPGEQFVIGDKLYGCERRLWFPDEQRLAVYAYIPRAPAEVEPAQYGECRDCGLVFDDVSDVPYCLECEASHE